MHEYGLCEAMVDAVVQRAGDRPVAEARFRIGALHRVDVRAFEQAFAEVAAGTVAEGARLDLAVLPTRAQCTECERNGELEEWLPLCPTCGGSVRLAGGDELVLESIRLRSADVSRHTG